MNLSSVALSSAIYGFPFLCAHDQSLALVAERRIFAFMPGLISLFHFH